MNVFITYWGNPMKKIALVLGALIVIIVCSLNAEGSIIQPEIGVARPSDPGNDAVLKTLCETIWNNIVLTLSIMGKYSVRDCTGPLPPDYPEGLQEYCVKNRLDSVIHGGIERRDGVFAISLSIYDRLKNDITVSLKTEIDNVLEIFDTADIMVVRLLEGFSGVPVRFGGIAFKNTGVQCGYEVLIDGFTLENSIESVDKVLIGRHSISILQQRPFEEYTLLDADITVREGEVSIVEFNVPELTPRETEEYAATDAAVAAAGNREKAKAEIENILEKLSGTDGIQSYDTERYMYEVMLNDLENPLRQRSGSLKMIPVRGGTYVLNYVLDYSYPVKLSGFLMAETEVTLNQFMNVMGKRPTWFDGSVLSQSETEADFPACGIGWDEVLLYCNRLSIMEGLEPVYDIRTNEISVDFSRNGYRLPTLSEWEYAAMGGRLSRGYKYPGSNNPGEVAWTSANSGFKLHPVAEKKPNELGLYDMYGNAGEWCWDNSRIAFPKNLSLPVLDPVNRNMGGGYILRGGTSGKGNQESYFGFYGGGRSGEDSMAGIRPVRSVRRR